MTVPGLVRRKGFAALVIAGAWLGGMSYLGCGIQDSATAPSGSPAVTFVPTPVRHQPLGSGSGSGSMRSERTIVASQGGVLTAGRHTVVIPPGALYQNTMIRVEDVSDDGFIRSELRPHGIVFRTPVTLITRFSDVTDPADYTMFWDATSPLTGSDAWVNVGGQVTADGTGIQVQLNHFSGYAPGKAGW